jgi:chaperonin GroES
MRTRAERRARYSALEQQITALEQLTGATVSSLRPLADRIVIRRTEVAEQTASGLYIPAAATEKPAEGTVLAVGPGTTDDNGNRVPLDIAVGDVVVYGKYGATEVTVDGEEYLILRVTDVFAVLDRE